MVLDNTCLRNSINPIICNPIFVIIRFILVFYKTIIQCFSRILTYIIFITLNDFFPITKIKLIGIIFNTKITIVTNSRLASISTFCCDKNNTVSSICSINGCCRSIFQDFHRFNVIRIDIIQRTSGFADRNSVNHNIRTRRCID